MLVKALTDFGGQYAMHKDDVSELPAGPVTDCLIRNGYIQPVASGKSEPKETDESKSNEAEQEDTINAGPAEEITKKSDIEKLTKEELINLAEERNVKIDPKAKKAEIIDQIISASEEE